MKNQALTLVAGVVFLVGCAGTSDEPGAVKMGAGLTLSHATSERLAGQYDREGVVVSFDSVRTGNTFRFEIRGADGRSLIRGEMLGTTFVTHVLDDRLVLSYQDSVEQGVTYSGDQAALGDLERSPESAILPWLSRQLGEFGYNGRDYPASLALHQFSRSVAERLNVEVPKMEIMTPAEGEAGYCQAYPNQGNQCYGMCGRGCSCWSWVCGDCCYHSGCARHDSYCRGSGFWDKVKCYTNAGAAAFGC
jgi:hypothetical protein